MNTGFNKQKIRKLLKMTKILFIIHKQINFRIYQAKKKGIKNYLKLINNYYKMNKTNKIKL